MGERGGGASVGPLQVDCLVDGLGHQRVLASNRVFVGSLSGYPRLVGFYSIFRGQVLLGLDRGGDSEVSLENTLDFLVKPFLLSGGRWWSQNRRPPENKYGN